MGTIRINRKSSFAQCRARTIEVCEISRSWPSKATRVDNRDQQKKKKGGERARNFFFFYDPKIRCCQTRGWLLSAYRPEDDDDNRSRNRVFFALFKVTRARRVIHFTSQNLNHNRTKVVFRLQAKLLFSCTTVNSNHRFFFLNHRLGPFINTLRSKRV